MVQSYGREGATPPRVGTDASIVGVDLTTGDYALGTATVPGAAEAVIVASSRDNATFTISVEWQDEAGNTLYTEQPQTATDAVDASLSFPVASDHINVTITDTSSSAQNTIDGSINVH